MISILLTLAAHASTISLSPGDDILAKTQGLGPGDEVFFNAGVYEIDQPIVWEGLGTAEQPIVLSGPDKGGEAIIRLTEGWTVAQVRDSAFLTLRNLTFEVGDNWEEVSATGLRVAGSTDITIEGCTIRNVASTALRIDGNGANFRVVRNHIHTTLDGSGIYVGCGDASCWLQDSVIAENQIHDLGGDHVTGIRLEHGSQNIEVRDNVIYRVATLEGGDGISMGSTEFGPPNLIVGNIIWEALDDGIWLEGAARVHNNIVFSVGDVGIGSAESSRGGLMDLVISHNTVVNTGGDGIYLEDWFHQEGMVFTNNAVANPIGYGFRYRDSWEEGETTSNYISSNHVTGLVTGFDLTLYPDWVVPGGGLSDFVDAENWNFYPARTSGLVDVADPAGEAWVPETDFNGAPREGNAPDVGAYEWSGATNPGWTVQEGFKELGYTGVGGEAIPSGCCGKKQDGGQSWVLLPLLGLLLRRRRHP